MKGLCLMIESANYLPFLGYYQEPQSYCLLKYKNEKKVSSISKATKNPFWMFQTQIYFNQISQNDFIEIFIYNSNSNAEDELLGWTTIAINSLNYITLTKCNYQLKNINGERIRSSIDISIKLLPHIQTDYFRQVDSIKVQLLRPIQKQQRQNGISMNLQNAIVKIQYAQKVTGLKFNQRNQTILTYIKQIDQIAIYIDNIQGVLISQKNNMRKLFNLKNLKQKKPQYFQFRFYDPTFPQVNYIIGLVFLMIPNSALPADFTTIQLNIKSQSKQNAIIVCHSPLQSTVIKTMGIPKMFNILNSQSKLQFQYYQTQKLDEKDLHKQQDSLKILKILSKYKAISIINMQVNELQWNKNYQSRYQWQIKLQKITKNVSLQLKAIKYTKSLQKSIYPVSQQISQQNSKQIKLQHLKIQKCYLYEILPVDSVIHLYYIDQKAIIHSFGQFSIKNNQTQYIIQSKARMINHQVGTLVAICYDFIFNQRQNDKSIQNKQIKNKPTQTKQINNKYTQKNQINNKSLQKKQINNKSLQNKSTQNKQIKDKQKTFEQKINNYSQNKDFINNHLVFKLETEKSKQIMSGRIIFNSYFLSFAKKVSLTKVCKKFQEMIHNQALAVSTKYKICSPFKCGLLQIVNCQFANSQLFNSFQLTIDSQTKTFQGDAGQYLAKDIARFFVTNNQIKINFTLGRKQFVSYHQFSEIFGYPQNTPNQTKLYKKQIQLKGGKITIWFRYIQVDQITKAQQINLLGQQNLNMYNPKIPLKIGVKKIQLISNSNKTFKISNQTIQKSLKIRLSQLNNYFQSQTIKSCSQLFIFNQKQNDFSTKNSTIQQSRYIFLNIQIQNKRDIVSNKSKTTDFDQIQEKTQFFYNSVIDLRKIVGRGVYQIRIYAQKSNKLQIIAEITIQTDNLLKKSFISNPKTNNPSLLLKLSNLVFESRLNNLQNETINKLSLFKPIYNYFIVIFDKKNNSYYSLISFDSNTKNCETQNIHIKQSFHNQNVYLDCKLQYKIRIISTLKKIQPKQVHNYFFNRQNIKNNKQKTSQNNKLFQSLQIQLIGQGDLSMNNIVLIQKDKNISKFLVKINFLGTNDLVFKNNLNRINLIKISSYFYLFGEILQNQDQTNLQILYKQIKNVDLSILKSFVSKIKIDFINISNQLYKLLTDEQAQFLINNQKVLCKFPDNLQNHSLNALTQRGQLNFSIKLKNLKQSIKYKLILPSYLKTNQQYNTLIKMGQFNIKLNIQCFSNTLTSFNNGKLQLKQISFANLPKQAVNQKIKVIYPSEQNSYLTIQKQLTKNSCLLSKQIQIQRSNKNILKQQIIIQLIKQGKKLIGKIQLSKLSIGSNFTAGDTRSMTIDFADQFQIIQNKSPLIVTLQGTYQIEQIEQLNQSSLKLKYNVLSQGKDIQISQKTLTPNRKIIKSDYKSSTLPLRQLGVKLELQIPQMLKTYLIQNNVQYLLDNIKISVKKSDQLQLIKSKQHPLIFYKYLAQQIQVQTIKLGQIVQLEQNKRFKLKIQKISQSNDKNNTKLRTTKFIVNQNANFILIINQFSYMIPKSIQSTIKQSFTIEINIHRLLSQIIFQTNFSQLKQIKQVKQNETKISSSNQKRLLWLKNSLNDQILTKKFCIYFKHGQQEQMIFDIDQQGNLINNNEKLNIVKFGYDPQDDQIDIFLCVEQIWNKNTYGLNHKDTFILQKYSYDQIHKRWIEIMPLTHFLLKVSDIKSNKLFFASVMKPFIHDCSRPSISKNLSQRLQPRNTIIFGQITFKQGNWGNLIVKIGKVGPLNIKSQNKYKDKSNKISTNLCFLKISIQYQRSVIKQVITQAKQIISGQYLSFNTYLSYLFLQNKDESGKMFLKFQMFTISDKISGQRLFQKRYPLQQILSREINNQKILLNISESDTNYLCDHLQVELLIQNSKNMSNSSYSSYSQSSSQKIKTISAIASENLQDIDLITYKNKSFIDILRMLLKSNDKTHFMQYLGELTQSFIYQDVTFDKEDSPFALLIILLPYLHTNMRFIYKPVLQMLQIAIIKSTLIIKNLQLIQSGRDFIYDIFMSIVQKDAHQQLLTDQKDPKYSQKVNNLLQKLLKIKNSNKIKDPKTKKQQNTKKVYLNQYFTKQIITGLKQCIILHSSYFIQSSVSQKYINEDIFILILNCIYQSLQYSTKLYQCFVKDFQKWIEFATFKSQVILQKFIQIVDKLTTNNLLIKRQQINPYSMSKFMTMLLTRKVKLEIIYQYWTKINYQQEKAEIFKTILDKYFYQQTNIEQKHTINQQSKQVKSSKQIKQITQLSSIKSTQKNKIEQKQKSIQQVQISKAKYLKIFCTEIDKINSSKYKKQKSARKDLQKSRVDSISQPKSTFGYVQKYIILDKKLIKNYQNLYQKTLQSLQHLNLLNYISELVITLKNLHILDTQDQVSFVSISKKYSQKDKKIVIKSMGINKQHNEQNGNKLLMKKNQKIIIDNLIKQLGGKQKTQLKIKIKEQDTQNQPGFNKFSKYLITR